MSWKDWIDVVTLMIPALVTAASVGIAASVLGVFVLVRREALLALAMPQVVTVGAAIGLRLGWPTLPPAMFVSAVALIHFVLAKRWGSGHWILPSFYIAGLSVSFLIIADSGQHLIELQNLFVGIDVAVTPARAIVAGPILLLLGMITALLWRRWLLLAQSPAAAELAGVHPARWDALFLSILTVVLLLGTDSLGTVMVLAMLFLPAAIVMPWVRRIPAAMLGAMLISILILASGFIFSNELSWPLSQSVGGVGFALLVVSHGLARVLPGLGSRRN